MNAHHFLDQAGLADDVAAPGRHLGHQGAILLAWRETEIAEDTLDLGARHVDSTEPPHALRPQRDGPLPRRRAAGDDQFRGLAATQLHHQAGGDLHAVLKERRVDAALETVAGRPR